MHQPYTLEIAVFSLQGALDAALAGADRLELCENAHDGGTTPSYGFLKIAKQLITIPIFPIIRPRGGPFVYSNAEFNIMKEDILLCKELGYSGVVIGMLDKDGEIDIHRTQELVELAGNMEVTFHRAFDRCAHPQKALAQLIDCGCKRILTSGQYPSVVQGMDLLKALIEQATDRIVIMPGSGVNSTNIELLAKHTQAKEFHTAARQAVTHSAEYSPSSMNESLSYVGVNQAEIVAIKSALTKVFV